MFEVEIEKREKIELEKENFSPTRGPNARPSWLSPSAQPSQQPGHPGPTPREARSGLLTPLGLLQPTKRARAHASTRSAAHSPLAQPRRPSAPLSAPGRVAARRCTSDTAAPVVSAFPFLPLALFPLCFAPLEHLTALWALPPESDRREPTCRNPPHRTSPAHPGSRSVPR